MPEVAVVETNQEMLAVYEGFLGLRPDLLRTASCIVEIRALVGEILSGSYAPDVLIVGNAGMAPGELVPLLDRLGASRLLVGANDDVLRAFAKSRSCHLLNSPWETLPLTRLGDHVAKLRPRD